jgi:hypothetical protein
LRTPRGFSAQLEHLGPFELALGKLIAGKSRAKNDSLSHSSHGVLQPFEFTFEIKIFYLVPIQMRLKKFRGINLSAAAVTYGGVISNIMESNVMVI